MRFAEKYGITLQVEDDWYDPLLSLDTPLYIDPFLIWEEKQGFWAGAHEHLLNFFNMVFDLIRESRGNTKSIAWSRAARLLMFPEPAEFCFGVSEGSPLGSGSAGGLRDEMLSGAKAAIDAGMYHIAHMEAVGLFQGGMGADRISDSVCNVLKSYFIEYTQEICRRHPEIETRSIRVRNSHWSSEQLRWIDGNHYLPINQVSVIRQGVARTKVLPVLLCPERFLRDLPFANADDFWNYSWATLSQELRDDFNFDLARNIGRREKARLARENPDAVALYLRHLEEVEKKPYSLVDDEKLLVQWYEAGGSSRVFKQPETVPIDPNQFGSMVDAIVDSFKHGIEHQDAWMLLWQSNRGAAERATQALFRSVVMHYCKANNIGLSGESNAGRGPVDFKFSQGWSAQALVEIKLMRSSKIWDGVLSQLPEYQLAEEVKRGHLVSIAYTDAEYTEDNKAKLREAAALASEKHGITIKTVLVDARKKEPASKLRDLDLSKKLHRSDDDRDEV